MKKRIFYVLLFAIACLHIKAQKKPVAGITGKITEQKSKEPVASANVSIDELGLYTITNEKGEYSFKDVPLGKFIVSVQVINMEPEEKEINIKEAKKYVLDFDLKMAVLNLKEVSVVATENDKGKATASKISRTAIDHLQAASIADVLQLMPGMTAKNPDLSKINKASIRQVNTDNINSLGTAIIVNGAPISNNANMQATNPAASGANASFSTSAGSGLDLRQISADNIESIEIIRGIPSVEYGDLTSGAILVKTKAGKDPFRLKARINPTLTQVWGGKGFSLGENGGSLNVSLDYTKAVSDQRFEALGYNRITGGLLYSKTFFKNKPLYTTTEFSYGMNLDEQKQDPDDAAQKIARKAQDYSYRFTTSGKWNLDYALARRLNYMFSVDYSLQKGFQQQQTGGAVFPITNSYKDTTMVSQYGPSEYLSQLWIEGKPLSLFAKVTDNFHFKTGVFNHGILAGTEWRIDANYGKGKTYDLNRPPNPNAEGNASRPRSYKDIPALNQLSFYIEDNISANIWNRNLYLQAGARYDMVQPFDDNKQNGVWSPRINLQFEVIKNVYLKGGYGITAKMPTLLYLYPQDAYFDIINLNYYATNPAERLLISTTRVFNTENNDLKIARNYKKEIGFDWRFLSNKRLSVTAFHEKLKNGYTFAETIAGTKIVDLQKYNVIDRPAGQPPVVEKGTVERRFAEYLSPTNGVENINKGVEFDLDLGRFDAIRTSFILNGAYFNSRSTNTAYYIIKGQSASGQVDPDKMAIFAPGRGTENEQFNTTLRVVNNFPEMRFVISFAAQTTWISRNKYLNYDSLPIGYIQRSDGNVVWLNDADRKTITRSNRELFLSIADEYYKTESWKPLWLFNLRLTKEIGKNVSFSFYANNVFMHRPLEESTRWHGQYTQRNQRLFFGSEISVKF